jgi:hypothetical protein
MSHLQGASCTEVVSIRPSSSCLHLLPCLLVIRLSFIIKWLYYYKTQFIRVCVCIHVHIYSVYTHTHTYLYRYTYTHTHTHTFADTTTTFFYNFKPMLLNNPLKVCVYCKMRYYLNSNNLQCSSPPSYFLACVLHDDGLFRPKHVSIF